MADKRPQILIVDDEPCICDLLREDLTDRGYVCTTALRSLDALARLKRQKFDIVLLDIMLPGMSGMELLKRIRSDHPDTETIMITGINRTDTMIDALNKGARDFIIKPIDLNELYKSIESLLGTKKQVPEERCNRTHDGNEREGERLFLEESTDEMTTIARRAAIGLDLCVKCERLLVEMTVKIARGLCVTEQEIQQWETARERSGSSKKKVAGTEALT